MQLVIKMDILEKPPVGVEPLYELLRTTSKHYKLFCIFYAAMNIRLFDCLESPKNPRELSEALGVDSRLVHVLCEVLTDLGFLKKRGGSYMNTKIADTYLKRNSIYSQYEVLMNLQGGFKLWENLTDILKNGPVRADEQDFFHDNMIHALAAEHLTGELQKTVEIVKRLPEFRRARSLLDLGGGHGLYAIAFAMVNPNLKAYVFDLPEVIKDTKAYIKRFGADRIETIEGNLFTDNLGKHDIIFFSYNPAGKNPNIVPKIHASLNDGGLFISKHAFYHKGEGSKNRLLDLEWNLTTWKGIKKGDKIYSFIGDLNYEDYLKLLKEYFTIKKIIKPEKFGSISLYEFGDTLDSKIIIAKKRTSLK